MRAEAGIDGRMVSREGGDGRSGPAPVSGVAHGERHGHEVVLEARGLRVQRAGRALADIDHLAIRRGETHALLGPNGAGKSTLLRALNGLVAASGELVFEGRRVATEGDRLTLRRRTAAVFQEPFLLATTVRRNVEEGLRLRGIAHLAERSRDGLSGGEAQRVSIARALAVDPAILFLDEPMASLDPPTRRGLLNDLLEIFAHRSTAVVWVTHDKDEAVAVADRVTFLSEGRVVQQGPCAEVFNRPATREVADYLGVDVWLEGEMVGNGGLSRFVLADGSTIVCGDGHDGPAFACIHPEDVVLFTAPPATGSTSLRNIVEGRVAAITPVGRLRRVNLQAGSLGLVATVTQAAEDELDLHVGDRVFAAFKAASVQVIPRGRRSYEAGDADAEV